MTTIPKRETVQVGDKWVKSVRWHETKMTPKAVVLTRVEADAARFLPQHAAEIRRVYDPARLAAVLRERQRISDELDLHLARALGADLLRKLGSFDPQAAATVERILARL